MNKVIAFLLSSILLAACKTQPSQSTEDVAMKDKNTELVNQYFEYFNNHEWEKMAEMYVENAEFKDPSLGEGIVKQSHIETIQKYSELNRVFPDLHDEIIQVYPSGEKHIIVEFISTGTGPDSTKFELPICTIFTFENGKITKDFTYYDNFEE